MGYLPHALLNYLSRLGWSHGDQEIFTRRELEQTFSLEHVGKSPSVMDPEKLRWLNAHYIKECDDKALAELLVPQLEQRDIQAAADPRLEQVAASLKARTKTLGEMAEAARFYFQAPENYDPKSVKKWWKPGADEILRRIRDIITEQDPADEQVMEKAFGQLAQEHTGGKLGKVAQPLRLALTGTTVSPPIFTVVAVLGRAECIERIDRALVALDDKA
jgi:glutamyl-tRNA synthetase